VLAWSMGVPAPEAASVGPLRRAAPASYAEGAPPGFSGGFGEQTCHACHFHAEVNAGRGRVTLAGVRRHLAPELGFVPVRFGIRRESRPLRKRLAGCELERIGHAAMSRIGERSSGAAEGI
jgi:hypothetical protein